MPRGQPLWEGEYVLTLDGRCLPPRYSDVIGETRAEPRNLVGEPPGTAATRAEGRGDVGGGVSKAEALLGIQPRHELGLRGRRRSSDKGLPLWDGSAVNLLPVPGVGGVLNVASRRA